MRRVFDFLRTADLPRLTRHNYVSEYRQMSLWGLVAAVVEGNMVSVVASKTFAASELLTTVIWATPVFMNVLNVAWGSFLRGRPRKQAFIVLSTCAFALTASVGFTSADWHPWGGWVFALQIALTHFFLSGLINLRTTIWNVNYPRSHRARIASRLQTVRMLMASGAMVGVSLLYDAFPSAYRWVYPCAGVIGVISLIPYSRLRMRGERAEMQRMRAHFDRTIGAAAKPHQTWLAGVREVADILRTDKLFARYMLAQFILGAANFFTEPILVNFMTKELDFTYFQSLSLLQFVPQIMLFASISIWAVYFDRIGVLRFRIYNSFAWACAYVAIAIGLLLYAIAGPQWAAVAWVFIVLSRISKGLGMGGGAIAWNLGHLHFARPHQTELYMGIHVGLTGLRGLLMPIVGYVCFTWMGMYAIIIPVVFAIVSHAMFRRLARQDPHDANAGVSEALPRA
jgi:type IV secretory pathway TrbD component